MKNKFLLCLSFVQIGTPSFYAPQAVVELSKSRIKNQLIKNYSIDAVFDSDACTEISNYELLADGIRLKASPKLITANVFLSYQELLEDQKILIPIAQDYPKTIPKSIEISNGDSSQSNKSLALGVLGIGVIGALFYFSSRQSNQSTNIPQHFPPSGVVKTF